MTSTEILTTLAPISAPLTAVSVPHLIVSQNMFGFKSKWERIENCSLYGEFGDAEIILKNVPCERNRRNGKVQFYSEWGYEFSCWLDRYWNLHGNIPTRVYASSPILGFVEVKDYPTVEVKIKYKAVNSEEQMIFETLEAILEGLKKLKI